MRNLVRLIALVGLCGTACGNGAGPGAVSDAGALDGGSSTGPDAGLLDGTAELRVPVPSTGRAYVNLAAPAVITPSGDAGAPSRWDLAFEGYGVFTNGGASGAGQGGAFGPLDLSTFASDTAPAVPFITADATGGAFVDWYAYDGTTHVLYSRFHVYGVKRGARLWKVQVLSYYGLQDNAPTSAIFRVRYAELTSGVGETQTVTVDGTAGGLSSPASAPSGCLSLATGQVSMLTDADAQSQTTWDLCFRRDAISVNGEAGGPGEVGAVDLQAAQTAGEPLAAVEAETADGEQPRFDGVDAASFAGAVFRGDHVVSAFESGGWLDAAQSPPAPAPGQAWLVVDASGQHTFLVTFSTFQNATTSSPGTVVMHLKPVSGSLP